MKKTKFIGVVNGVEYNNIKDYNIAITKAIEENSLVSASSKTEVVDEPSSLLLGFDGSKPANSYVDDYITQNVDQNIKNLHDLKNLKDLKNKLEDNYEVVLREINDMDKHAIENYLVDINEVLKNIKDDILKTQSTLDAKSTQLEELKQQVCVLKQGRLILEDWFNYYSMIKSNVESINENRCNGCCDEKCTCCDEKCTCCDEKCTCCDEKCTCCDENLDEQLSKIKTFAQAILNAFVESKKF